MRYTKYKIEYTRYKSMSLKDFFKKKKEPEKKREKVSSEVLVKEKKREVIKEVEEDKSSSSPFANARVAEKVTKETVEDSKKTRKKTDEGLAYRVLKAPHITEKATDLAKKNKYVFKVYERTNKIEIRKAVEKLYNVNVLSVKIIKVGPKKRIFKGIKGERKGYKKAIVEIKKGQEIEIFSK